MKAKSRECFSLNNYGQRRNLKAFGLLLVIILISLLPIVSVATDTNEVSAIGTSATTDDNRSVISNVSGNLFYSYNLLNISELNSPIELYMIYGSIWHNFENHFGKGWELNYNAFYTRVENGNIIIYWGGCGADKFIQSKGTFQPQSSIYTSFKEYKPDKYMVETIDGMKYYFDSPVHKKITSIQGPNGHVLNFLYNSDLFLTTIIDDSGRQVNLNYSNGNLVNITDSSTVPTRSIKLKYDNNNNLINIINELGNTMTYSYDTAHFLTSVIDSKGNTAFITYSNGYVVNVSYRFTNVSLSNNFKNRVIASATEPTPTQTPTKPNYDEMAQNEVDLLGDMMNRQASYSAGGGNEGGMESMPLKNINPSYFYKFSSFSNQKAVIKATDEKMQLNPSNTLSGKLAQQFDFLSLVNENDILPKISISDMALSVPTIQLAKLVSLIPKIDVSEVVLSALTLPGTNLTDIIPSQGPAGTHAVHDTASKPFEVGSNAIDAVAVDYIDNDTSHNRATVFATTTVNKTYDHDYVICNRFHNYTLETASAVPLPGVIYGTTDSPWFWHIAMTKGELVEEAFIFAVYVDEDTKTFTVDSHWLTHQYPGPDSLSYDYIYNFQIWASSSEDAYNLLRQTLSNLAKSGDGWKVTFANTKEPVEPTVIIKSAEFSNGVVKMTVQSWLTQPQSVSFSGSARYITDLESDFPFSYDVTIKPGFNIVELPLGSILDGVIDINVNGFMDKVYIGSGSWFAFDDRSVGGSSIVTLSLPKSSHGSNLNSNDFILAGCAQMNGSIGAHGWGGMGRTLNPNSIPIDVSQYPALTFFARGDGKSYRVNIETNSVRQLNSSDFHQFVFTPSSEWKQYVIPLSAFSQRGWDQNKIVPYTGKDVVSVTFTVVGEPLDSINLTIDGLAFFKSTLVSKTTVLPDTRDTTGPYAVNTQVTDGISVQTVSLFYSLDKGQTFTSVPMVSNGNTYSASIPGQAFDTEVLYYIEAKDSAGNVATDPVDIPYAIYRFQVSEHPYLLVDNFEDTNPTNTLGAETGLFNSDVGGSITAFYKEGQLRLDYNVLKAGSYSGYYSLLIKSNIKPYTALTFMIKGSKGGERVKVGIRDVFLNEEKVEIRDYLSQGITTSWQKVIIPLENFSKTVNLSSMDNFDIAFENYIDSGSGTIYLDDFKFEYLNNQSPLPVADFSANVTSGVAPLSVKFTDLSQNADVWKWDFGDGNISNEKSPVHTYFSSGNYTVNLTVSNANGTASKSASINVSKPMLPVFPGCTKPPIDPNNDGLYEDINGNGRLDFADVVVYFNNMIWITQNSQITYFDYNRNSRIDFNDVVRLFNMH